MRGRESRSGAPNSADLLVCFPSRAHLTLMPKAICSPVRPSETSKRHNHNHNHNHSHSHSLSLGNYNNKNHLKRSRTRGQGSPLLWAKSKTNMGQEMDEPTSPKVTCAGQIRVRPKTAGDSCKNWQSVMEEIERIHKKGRQKKKPSWMEALGFKKEVMQFLTCLRSLRLDFRCFGSLPAGADITSDEEEEEEEGEEEDADDESSRTVFSKWFMVLQENQNKGFCDMEEKEKIKHDVDQGEEAACVPPPNALMLMRCRSAPAKSWLEEKAEEEEEGNDEHENEDDEDEEKEKDKEEEEKKKEKLVLMRYDTEFYKISSDIAKETWVVGGSMGDALCRSRSWKR